MSDNDTIVHTMDSIESSQKVSLINDKHFRVGDDIICYWKNDAKP